MRIPWSRYLSLPFAGALALAAFGCGDDDGGGDRPDARPRYDAAGEIDADTGPTLLRSGTIAVTEASITNNLGVPFSGPLVRASFSDATTGNAPAPVDGFDSVINNCNIQIWDVGTHTASTSVDEGPIQVTGTENGPFACGFANADLGYVCQSTDANIAGGTAGNGEGFILTGATDELEMVGFQASASMKGMYIVLNGFAPVPDGTRIPITDVDEATDTLTLFGVNDALTVTGDANASFSTYVGVRPVPLGAQFLLGEADAINVTKAAGDVVPMIDEDFHAHGQNFALVDDGAMNKYLPSTVPVTPAADAVEVNFECTECGAVGDGGTIAAIVINGETTDGDTGGVLNPSDPMPDPVTQYATFTCAFVAEDTATLSADMMAAILGTNPTRIQTSVGRYRGSILMDTESGEWSVNVLQGHALLGWSDKPPPK